MNVYPSFHWQINCNCFVAIWLTWAIQVAKVTLKCHDWTDMLGHNNKHMLRNKDRWLGFRYSPCGCVSVSGCDMLVRFIYMYILKPVTRCRSRPFWYESCLCVYVCSEHLPTLQNHFTLTDPHWSSPIRNIIISPYPSPAAGAYLLCLAMYPVSLVLTF